MQKNKLHIGIAILLWLLSFMLLCKTFFLHTYPDFRIFYTSARSFLEGRSPYILSGGFTPFLYPPFALLIFIPFTLFPLVVAEKLWLTVSLILFYTSIYFLFRLSQIKKFSLEGILLLTISNLAFPVKFSLGMGQINMVLLFLLSLSLLLLSRKEDTKSGFLLGILILTKLFSPFLILWAVLLRRWQVILSLFISVVVLIAITAIVLTPSLYLYYAIHVLPGLVLSSPVIYYNQSLSGFFLRFMGLGNIVHVCIFFCQIAIALVSMGYVIRNKRKNPILSFSLFLTMSLLLSPLSWQHYFVLLLPCYIIYYSVMRKSKMVSSMIVLLISFILVNSNIKNLSVFPMIVTGHVFFGALLLWVVGIQLLKREI